MKINLEQEEAIDTYISKFPIEIQKILEQIRQTIIQVVPDAKEAMSYQMPTFKLHGKNLVHFAAWKNHIGFYPTPSATNIFKNRLQNFPTSKGSIQFPFRGEIPYQLIRDITEFRAKEISESFKSK